MRLRLTWAVLVALATLAGCGGDDRAASRSTPAGAAPAEQAALAATPLREGPGWPVEPGGRYRTTSFAVPLSFRLPTAPLQWSANPSKERITLDLFQEPGEPAVRFVAPERVHREGPGSALTAAPDSPRGWMAWLERQGAGLRSVRDRMVGGRPALQADAWIEARHPCPGVEGGRCLAFSEVEGELVEYARGDRVRFTVIDAKPRPLILAGHAEDRSGFRRFLPTYEAVLGSLRFR